MQSKKFIFAFLKFSTWFFWGPGWEWQTGPKSCQPVFKSESRTAPPGVFMRTSALCDCDALHLPCVSTRAFPQDRQHSTPLHDSTQARGGKGGGAGGQVFSSWFCFWVFGFWFLVFVFLVFGVFFWFWFFLAAGVWTPQGGGSKLRRYERLWCRYVRRCCCRPPDPRATGSSLQPQQYPKGPEWYKPPKQSCMRKVKVLRAVRATIH